MRKQIISDHWVSKGVTGTQYSWFVLPQIDMSKFRKLHNPGAFQVQIPLLTGNARPSHAFESAREEYHISNVTKTEHQAPVSWQIAKFNIMNNENDGNKNILLWECALRFTSREFTDSLYSFELF